MYISVQPVIFNDEELELIHDTLCDEYIGFSENSIFNDEELEFIYDFISSLYSDIQVTPCYADKYGEDPQVIIANSILTKIKSYGIFI